MNRLEKRRKFRFFKEVTREVIFFLFAFPAILDFRTHVHEKHRH